MSVITLLSGIDSNADAVIQNLVERTGFCLMTDEGLAQQAADLSGIDFQTVLQAFSPKKSVFNAFTHEKETCISYLKLALARNLHAADLICYGYSGLLIPKTIPCLLSICLISGQMQNTDKWRECAFCPTPPWDPSLHDMVISMAALTPVSAVDGIVEALAQKQDKFSDMNESFLNDFLLAAQTEAALASEGHCIRVQAASGNIDLFLDEVASLSDLIETEIRSIAGQIPGVNAVTVHQGTVSSNPVVYHKYNRHLPSKLLLVDDEEEFVQTLSERLQMRQMGTATAYDGFSALELIEIDTPEIVVMDLKMPHMDGIQVLETLKQKYPQIEVIILTGHGSERDRQTCMELGAFDYLQKPVDMTVLSAALKNAHEKITTADRMINQCSVD